MPDEMDVHRLIAEVKKRPTLWDVRFSEYKDRTNTPQMWQEIAEIVGFDVEHCKRKWKNLRDAYRAEVRRTERRLERMKSTGQYDGKTNLCSKWVYFEPMNFINESKRGIKHGTTTDVGSEGNSASLDEQPDVYDPAFNSFCDIKMEHHVTTDEEEEAADDILFEKFKNVATPQAARRVSVSIANTAVAEEPVAMVINQESGPSACNCTKRDQVNFLENLEREEQKLMQSTRQDMTRVNTLGHVGDADYNFLVSFLPQMKKMSELQNLQFRAKMSELLLNSMTPPLPPLPPPLPALPSPSLALSNLSNTPVQQQDSQQQVQLQIQTDTMETEQSDIGGSGTAAISSSNWS